MTKLQAARTKTGMRGSDQGRQAGFCSTCGRPRSGSQRPFCSACTDLFSLPRGQSLYDGDTGRVWFRSTGSGTLVRPGRQTQVTVDSQVDDSLWQALRGLWPILLVGLAIINGCLRMLR